MDAKETTKLIGIAKIIRGRGEALARALREGDTAAMRRFSALLVEDAARVKEQADRLRSELGLEHGWPVD
jgi:hypothetical protein